MSLVRFYACAGDPIGVAARLARKAYEQGEVLCICAEPAALEKLSEQLWLAEVFLAHAGPDSNETVRRVSRVELSPTTPGRPVALLMNVNGWLAPDCCTAEKVFDVFGGQEEERQAARQRFRWYKDAGREPEAVQVAAA